MIIHVATLQNFDSWLELAKEVEPLFGPMASEPSFHDTLKRVISDKRAFCIRENDGAPSSPLCGAVLISRKKNEIGWLAVAKKHRRKGLGKTLLCYALEKLDKEKPISVKTFDKTVTKGIPARNLYIQFGFTEVEKSHPNPAGVPTIVMVRPKSE